MPFKLRDGETYSGRGSWVKGPVEFARRTDVLLHPQLYTPRANFICFLGRTGYLCLAIYEGIQVIYFHLLRFGSTVQRR